MTSSSMDIFAVQKQLRAGSQIPQELTEVFREESEDHIFAIYDGLDRLRVELNDFDALADIRRSSHTLKGAAGAVGHDAICRLAHRMEDLLDSLFENKQPLTHGQLELLLVTTDHLQELSVGEFDFDDTVKSLLDVYHRFEQQFATVVPTDSSLPTDLDDSSGKLEGELEGDLEVEPALPESTEEDWDDQLEAAFEKMLNGSDVDFDLLASTSIDAPESLNDSPIQADAEGILEEAKDTEDIPADYLELAFEQLNVSVDVQPEIQAIFMEEAEELLRSVYGGLDRLKQNLSDYSALSDIRRSAHTLKGAAGAVGMEAITRMAHRMEDLLDALTEKRRSITDSQLQILLMTADCVQDLSGGSLEIVLLAESMASLYAHYDREMQVYQSSGDANIPAVEPSVAPFVEPTVDASISLVAVNKDLAKDLEKDTSADESMAATTSKNTADKHAENLSSNSGQYLRVPLERLDGLVALLGEMVVNRSAMSQRLADFESRIQDMQLAVNRFQVIAQDMEQSFSVRRMALGMKSQAKYDHTPVNRITSFTQSKAKLSANTSARMELDSLEFDRYSQLNLLSRSIAEATNDMAMITNEFRNIYGDIDSLVERQQRYNHDAQDGLMQIRMLPISSIVSRLERTVRTVSNKLGKHVDLVVVGEKTELDKTVLEEITDPLLHLIRNALDHGIETSELRTAAGKPPRACLTLETLNQGTQVTLRVSDDGRGLDFAKIRNKAVEQGLINARTSTSNEDLQDLIFLPGFSTAESLTDISGRGVGMDVVREAVQRLKGTIRVESRPGKGATFTIHLPTSLSVTRALIVTSGSHTFALPMQSVEQIMRMDMVTTSKVGLQTFINRDEKLVRLNDLAQHLEIRAESKADNALASQPVLLIRSGDDQVAISVDSVRCGQDIVVKTLGDHLRHVAGYLGATLTGDGTVIPILDPSDLCGEKMENRTSQFFKANETKIKRRNTVMVIDDSLSVRRVATNLLRSNGWDVIDAKDGMDALEKLGSNEVPPDIFLCDMEMPRMDGLELIERLRGMPEFKSTPIVMVTSRSSEKHRRLAANAGANEHVVKPFKDDQLIELIERMVAEHRELVGV